MEGIEDFFEKKNIKVFGPNKIASQLEGSKIFTKNFEKYKIPTAKFGIYKSINESLLSSIIVIIQCHKSRWIGLRKRSLYMSESK